MHGRLLPAEGSEHTFKPVSLGAFFTARSPSKAPHSAIYAQP